MAQKGPAGQTDNGNINRIAIKAGHLVDIHKKIRLRNFGTLIENMPTSINESSKMVLKYQTPNFRANAVVEIAPIPDKHKYKVGWIQACTDMVFHNTYSDDGYTSWLFPELNSGAQTMISDCDGKNYPWYGSHDETVTFDGPCNMYQSATITMHDNFHPHVTWRNPADNTTGPANLTHISRDQSFYVWLVVWDMILGKAYVMKTVKWNMNLDIKVDPSKPLGKRAKLVSDPFPKQPLVLEETISIPRCALMPPNANHAQMLVWCPTTGNAQLIIPPIWKKDLPIGRQVPPHDSKHCLPTNAENDLLRVLNSRTDLPMTASSTAQERQSRTLLHAVEHVLLENKERQISPDKIDGEIFRRRSSLGNMGAEPVMGLSQKLSQKRYSLLHIDETKNTVNKHSYPINTQQDRQATHLRTKTEMNYDSGLGHCKNWAKLRQYFDNRQMRLNENHGHTKDKILTQCGKVSSSDDE